MSENPEEFVRSKVPGGAEDELIQDPQQTDDPPAEEVVEPVQPEHGNFDVRYQSADENDADYQAEETNSKEVTDE